MCLGIPAQIISIKDDSNGIAEADIGGVTRDINVSLLAAKGTEPHDLIGQFVLVHVGFAMALINKEEADKAISLLKSMEDSMSEITPELTPEIRQTEE